MYDFSKSRSQRLKANHNLHKIHNVQHQYQNHKPPSLNKKCKPPSLIIAYLYGLGSNSTTMLELYRCCGKVKSRSVHESGLCPTRNWPNQIEWLEFQPAVDRSSWSNKADPTLNRWRSVQSEIEVRKLAKIRRVNDEIGKILVIFSSKIR